MKKLIISIFSIISWIVVVILIYVLFIPRTYLKTISYLTMCLGLTGAFLSLISIIRRKRKNNV